MPVKSYLAHTIPHSSSDLVAKIAAIPGCTVIPAGNRDALVIVTDTPSEDAEATLRARLDQLDGLASLTLVSAFTADDDLISLSRGAS